MGSRLSTAPRCLSRRAQTSNSPCCLHPAFSPSRSAWHFQTCSPVRPPPPRPPWLPFPSPPFCAWLAGPWTRHSNLTSSATPSPSLARNNALFFERAECLGLLIALLACALRYNCLFMWINAPPKNLTVPCQKQTLHKYGQNAGVSKHAEIVDPTRYQNERIFVHYSQEEL